MTDVKDLLRILAEFDQTPESVGVDLRLDLADLVMLHLDRKGWTQKDLARQTGMKESFVSRIIHAESNCTFDVAGRIMHALGVRVQIQEPLADRLIFHEPVSTAGTAPIQVETQDDTNGQENSQTKVFRGQKTPPGSDIGSLRFAETG